MEEWQDDEKEEWKIVGDTPKKRLKARKKKNKTRKDKTSIPSEYETPEIEGTEITSSHYKIDDIKDEQTMDTMEEDLFTSLI